MLAQLPGVENRGSPECVVSVVNVLHIKDPLASDSEGNGKAFFSGPCKTVDSVHRNAHYSLSSRYYSLTTVPAETVPMRFIKPVSFKL